MKRFLAVGCLALALGACARPIHIPTGENPRPTLPFPTHGVHSYQVPLTAYTPPSVLTFFKAHCDDAHYQLFEDGTTDIVAHACDLDIQKVSY